MSMKSFLASAAGAAAFAIALGVLLKRQDPDLGRAEALAHAPRFLAPGVLLPVLWDAPAFSFVDQNGRRFTNRDLDGRVWIGDFMFTSCTSICPMMTARMAQLQTAIPSDRVHFVSFSVDPDRDSPAVLRTYAKMWEADASRWHFLATDREGLTETARGMKTFVQPPDTDGSIQHSGIFTLADGKGRVRGVYDSADSEALRQLVRDALALADLKGAGVPLAGTAWTLPAAESERTRPGRALYASAGCAACHSQARVAPSLEGRLRSRVDLDDGREVVFDEAYVRESILDASEKVVAGYPRMMPSYRGQLTDAQVDQLVEYVLSLPPPKGSASEEKTASAGGRELVDPVCGMAVSSSGNRPTETYRGRVFHFCSEACRGRFRANPAKFASRGNGAEDAHRMPPTGAPGRAAVLGALTAPKSSVRLEGNAE